MASNTSNDVHTCDLYSQGQCIEELELDGALESVQNIEDANPVIHEHDNFREFHEFSKPHIGMIFDTHDAAYEYYNLYARVTGFSVRKSYFHKSSETRKFANRLLVCSKQGHKDVSRYSEKEVKRRRNVRDGCNAHILLSEIDGGKWEVRKFEEEHSHILTTPSKISNLRSHNIVSDYSKEMMTNLHDRGFGPSNIVKVLNFNGDTSITSEKCRNHLKSIRKNNIGGECMKVMAYFLDKQVDDEGFIFKWEKDENDNARSLFWADGRSRDNYMTFGDVVIFDTTYRTNNFCMPFAPFTGVNHHRQSILFGCALLSDETEDTFIWLFQTWLQCMNLKYPLSIITDQDIAMGNAIRKVFPNTRHRFCIWHIRNNAVINTQDLCARGNFLDDFHKWIYYSVSIEDFENTWVFLKEKYSIPNDHWAEKMYNKRRHWVPIYFRDVFFAGMSTTQRSESMNSFFDGFVNSNTSLSEFVHQYDQALSSRREAEELEDFKTINSKAVVNSENLLEYHAGQIYTKKVFALFQMEYKELTSLLSRKLSKDANKVVYSIFKMGKEDNGRNIVEYNDHQSISISCSCGKFEQDGIFCKHILYVLFRKGVKNIPDHYILHRWTIDARYSRPHAFCDVGSTFTNEQLSITPLQKYTWRTNIWKFTQAGLHSLEHLKLGMSVLDETFKKFAALKVVDTSQSLPIDIPTTSNGVSQCSKFIIHDPKYVKPKGRPRKAERIKSGVEISMSQAEKLKYICKTCKKPGHNSRSCKLHQERQGADQED